MAKPVSHPHSPHRRNGGFAAVTALGFLLIVVILVGIAAVSAVGNRKNATYSIRVSQAQYAAESGLEEAVYQVWHSIWNGTKPSSSEQYRVKLSNSSQVFKTPGATYTVSRSLSGGVNYNLSITRRNMANNDVIFDITSTGTLQDGTTRVLSQVFKVAGTLFNGFDYALLTNNVNCIFCHTSIQDMSALGGKATSANPQNRIKVASLETMQIRPDWEEPNQHDHVDTVIAGTLYLRGKFQDKSGQDLTGRMSDLSLKTTQVANEEAIKSTSMLDMSAQDCSNVNNCKDKPYKNFYVNYPDKNKVDSSLGGKWPDGVLPDKFPLPIPEKGTPNNRIDQAEWDEVVDNSNNNLDPDNPKGKITGGKITVNPSGSYDWPASGNASQVVSTKWNTKQNVILDGSSSTLKLEGTTYINGDVIIRGKVSGTGKIIASGNVYVLGDVTYDCSPKVCDYTKPETLPQLALIAGGNMMIGDFSTRRMNASTDTSAMKQASLKAADLYVDTGGKNLASCAAPCNIMSFSAREAAIFNRSEMEKAVLDSSYIPRFYIFEKDAPMFFYNKVNGEGTDNYKDSTLIGLQSTGGKLLNKTGVEVTGNTTVKTTQGDKVVSAAAMKAILDKANMVTLASTNDWISKQQLKSLWVKSVECAASVAKNGDNCGTSSRSQGPLRTDGLLYSSNALFSIARGSHSNGQVSRLQGRWDLRGSMAAADTGVLVTGSNPSKVDNNTRNKMTEGWNSLGPEGVDPNTERGLSIYYDARMKNFMKIKQDDLPILQRSEWKVGTK